MEKYRLKSQGINKVIQEWVPPKPKRGGGMTQGKWKSWKYYGKWSDAIRWLINYELVPIRKPIKEQLEQFDKSLEKATQKVIDTLIETGGIN